jgi:fructokinase
VFLVIGESIADLIGRGAGWTFDARPGGSPLNVAAALARLGEPVRFASQIGDDVLGAMLRSHLVHSGVLMDGIAADDLPTNLAFVRLDASGVASYDFRVAWSGLAAGASLRGVDYLHTGSLAATMEPGRALVLNAMRRAHRSGVCVSYDPNIRPAFAPDRAQAVSIVEKCIGFADVVKASDADISWLYPYDSIIDVARRWIAHNSCRLVVVTRGADGAVALYRSGELWSSAPGVRVEDTVGAGDSFMAGLLHSLRRHGTGPLSYESVHAALRFANAAASVVCGRRGADPPTGAEVEGLLRPTENA